MSSEKEKELKATIYASIEKEIDKLDYKSDDLMSRNYSDLAEYIEDASFSLRILSRDYFDREKFDYNTYKKEALDIIEKYRPVLNKHRGYKQILGNLLILITTLGTAQLANKAINGKFLFFNTDSAKKIDNIRNAINNVHQM